MIDIILKLTKQDYWKMTDVELVKLADKYCLIEESKIESISYNIENNNLNPNYTRNILNQKDRIEIIKGLVSRKYYANSITSTIFSIFSLTISIIALVLSR